VEVQLHALLPLTLDGRDHLHTPAALSAKKYLRRGDFGWRFGRCEEGTFTGNRNTIPRLSSPYFVVTIPSELSQLGAVLMTLSVLCVVILVCNVKMRELEENRLSRGDDNIKMAAGQLALGVTPFLMFVIKYQPKYGLAFLCHGPTLRPSWTTERVCRVSWVVAFCCSAHAQCMCTVHMHGL